MKLHLADTAGLNVFTACGEGYVAINGLRREGAAAGGFIVLPERVIEDWTRSNAATLGEAEIAALRGLGVTIVLLGTGRRQIFPPTEQRRALAALTAEGIGVEIMDTAAACRTYNILVGEGRTVAAALLTEG